MPKYTQLLEYLKKNFIPIAIVAVVIIGGIIVYANNHKFLSLGNSGVQGLTAPASLATRQLSLLIKISLMVKQLLLGGNR